MVAHGNSIRGIVKHLSGMSKKEILKFNMPNSVPLVYEFDENMTPLKHYFLLDEDELKKRQEAIAEQASAR